MTGAISKFDGHIFTFDFNNKKNPCLRCFYQEETISDDILNCEYEGILGTVAGIIGTMQANEILKKGVGIKNKDKATDFYYCAALGYLDIGKKNAAADMYNAMRNSAIHNDPRTVEVYARLHNNDTVSNMRKSVSQTSRLDSETSKISRQ